MFPSKKAARINGAKGAVEHLISIGELNEDGSTKARKKVKVGAAACIEGKGLEVKKGATYAQKVQGMMIDRRITPKHWTNNYRYICPPRPHRTPIYPQTLYPSSQYGQRICFVPESAGYAHRDWGGEAYIWEEECERRNSEGRVESLVGSCTEERFQDSGG